MKINIYPYNPEMLDAIDLINSYIEQYDQCNNYIDLFLGNGIVFNNLTKSFNKYILNDYKNSTINFYKLLKTQLPEYVINECEYYWKEFDINDLTQILLKEKNNYKKCIEYYVLENKVSNKEIKLDYFPSKELEYVSFKLKKNDILFSIDKVSDVYSKATINDLLFINLDNVYEKLHRKIIQWSTYVSCAVNVIYSSIGSNYLSICKNCQVAERINETGFLFIFDNELSKEWYNDNFN